MDNQKIPQMKIKETEHESKSEGQSRFCCNQVSRLPQILQESRRFTLNFIKELKEKALTPISQEVLDHYHGQIMPNYSVKDVINIIDKRISKMIRNKKIKKNWNFDDITLLLWFVSKYIASHQGLTCQKFTNKDWQYISKFIPGSSPRGCMFKFISLKKVKLSSYNWSQKEDDILSEMVKKLGQNKWKQIAQYLYEHNPTQKVFRTPKQCRQHWNCYLDPKLKKGPWSESEDLKLLQNVKENKGQRKWSSIKHLFEGRTQNALKNRYNLLLERQKKLKPGRNQSELVKQYLKLKGSSYTTIDHLGNFVEVRQQISHQELPQKIYQEAIEENKEKILSPIQQKLIGPQTFMKSQKSSFSLSQAYKKSKYQQENNIQDQQIGQNDIYKNFMLLSVNSMPSIMTNSRGFYTNFLYKPFYF